jgi:hypothetical protein
VIVLAAALALALLVALGNRTTDAPVPSCKHPGHAVSGFYDPCRIPKGKGTSTVG